MFKKAMMFLAAGLLSVSAFAGDKTVTGVDGVKTLGAETLLAVRINGTAAEALYGSGWQSIADDASHSKVNELITKCGSACVTVDGNYGISAVAAGRSNGIYCQSSLSKIAFANLGQPIEIPDGCAFWQKAK